MPYFLLFDVSASATVLTSSARFIGVGHVTASRALRNAASLGPPHLPLFPVVASATARQVISNLEARLPKANISGLVAWGNNFLIGKSETNSPEESAADRTLSLDLLRVAQEP